MWIFPLACMGVVGLLFGAGLAYASRKFAVKIDPRVQEVLEALPGVNCGACGYPGCSGYAEAVAGGKAAPNLCAPGGQDTTENICLVLGIEAQTSDRQVAYIRCQGAREAIKESAYIGPQSCKLATMVEQGPIACKNACLMLGDCQLVCPFDAIRWEPGTIPVIDEEKCTACKKCIAACPKALIILRPQKKRVLVLCRSQDKGAVAKKKCPAACIACQKCVKACPVDAISMDGNVAVIDTETCVLCGKCVTECPTNAIWDGRPPRPAQKATETVTAEAVTA